jgi:GT2 family glycosyltransferase
MTAEDAAPGGSVPVASVVLCLRNAAATVEAQLEALALQDMAEPWELVIVDNGCTDDTMEIVDRWTARIPGARVVEARDRAGLGHARNVGVGEARGALVAFCDGDDVASATWLRELVSACPAYGMAGGALDLEMLNDEASRYWRGEAPAAHGLPVGHAYLPYALGASFAISRQLYVEIGGCDERFLSSSDDVDLSWRVQQAGRPLVFASRSTMHYRLRESARVAAAQRFAYGRSEAILYAKHRQHLRRQVAGWRRAVWFLLSRSHHLIRGRRLRGRWMCIAWYHAGRLRGSWEQRVWFP